MNECSARQINLPSGSVERKQKKRLRRMRKTAWSRDMVQENYLQVHDLIWPLFVVEEENTYEPIHSMPGVFRLGTKKLMLEIEHAAKLGIPAIALFPVVPHQYKDVHGSYILSQDNIIHRATKEIKKRIPEIGIITDTALDPFTSHGHDGILKDGKILNDETVEQLAMAAVLQAQAGSDIIAPSDMMDGRVRAIREALDKNGFQDIPIMSYAAKFCSDFYGPYRDAIHTKEVLQGDKKTYYLNPANSDEAMRQVSQDIQEGADMLIVKPGLPYLDIICRMKEKFSIPIFGYQVSGEYSMIKAASSHGWINEEKAVFESLIAFKRSGCTGILTYFALDVAKRLKM